MIRRDPLFKGCTRPAMFWGVPIVPFVLVFGFVTLLALWFTMLFFLTLPVIYVVMRLVVRSDEQQFHLLWLKAKCRLVQHNTNARFWKASAYSPVAFTKRK